MKKTASLTEDQLAVILNKGTEKPFSGLYDDYGLPCTYLCRQCGLALFRAQTKFPSGCGWPSFDEEIPNTVLQKRDADGVRTEILCARCHAHLGHVFFGERLTNKDTRYCVNSVSLDHVADQTVSDTEEIIFAAGCFWGVEHYLKKLDGVLKTEVGYIGGKYKKPTYEDVCTGNTGHYEAVRVIYNPKKINFENLAKFFFEIHDYSQKNGQGPDIGSQYLSAIFYYDNEQKKIAEKLIAQLQKQGDDVATVLLPAQPFWIAENYHQNYYAKTGKMPYCHHYQKKF